MNQQHLMTVAVSVSIVCLLLGCTNETVLYGGASLEAGPLEIGVDIDSHGNVVLDGCIKKRLFAIGAIGSVGLTAGVETTLHKAKREYNSLFILQEDSSGRVFLRHYRIGEPFTVQFTAPERVREIRTDANGNVIVVVELRGSPPSYEDLREDIKDLIERWDEIHSQADRYWDTSALDTVLQRGALQEQMEVVEFLQQENCYWVIHELEPPRITDFELVKPDLAIVEVYKNWDMDFYCDGVKEQDKDGPFVARYKMEYINDRWYIIHKSYKSSGLNF